MTNSLPLLFDIDAVIKHKKRALKSKSYQDYTFFHEIVAKNLVDRLTEVTLPLQNFVCSGFEFDYFIQEWNKVQKFAAADTNFLSLDQQFLKQTSSQKQSIWDYNILPVEKASSDCFISLFDLHWMNDVPGFLAQIYQSLKEDRLFIGAFIGGNSLIELRHIFAKTEEQIFGGTTPRVSPMIDIADAGQLLQRAGFQMPMVDKESFQLTYDHPLKFLQDLRGMGETNAWLSRSKRPLTKTFIDAFCKAYSEHFSTEDQKVYASFDIIYVLGWTKGKAQPKAAKRGSGQVSLTEILQ